MQKLISFAFILLFLFGCTQPQFQNSAKITFQNSNLTINAKIADTPQLRSKGLMYTNSMPQNEGMLFIYEKEQPLSFWMANTKIPLDIIFLNKNKTIVDIQKMQPCTQLETKNCENYISKQKAIYAIEINQNLTEKYNIKIGQKAGWD